MTDRTGMGPGRSDQPARAPEAPPLDGVLVLDLSRVLAGPLCAQILGDLGATVLKIEHPGRGDDTRGWGPPFHGGEAGYFLSANRNKRSIAVDLKHPEGARVVSELAERADILVENYRTGTLDGLGLGPDTLLVRNPRLIYVSVSGYGRTGPRADDPGYDFVIQAESGLMALTGEPDGDPVKVGLPISDLVSGLSVTQSVLAALLAQRRDGHGQHIDFALLEGQLAAMANVGIGCLITDQEATRYGNAHPNIVPYQVFRAADGPFVLAVGTEGQYRKLCEQVLQRADLADDARFRRNEDRVRNRALLVSTLASLFVGNDLDHWLTRARRAGIPAGRVRGVHEALHAPEVAERGLVVTMDHPSGPLSCVGSPHRFSRTPVRSPTAPPLLGADGRDALSTILGYSEARIAALEEAGAIGRRYEE